MIEKTIINIPIYRCTQKQFEDEMKQEEKRLYKFFHSPFLPKNCDVSPQVEKTMEENWRCWQYNEIVGFIEIFILGDQIRGTRYFIDHKKVRKDIKKKKFIYQGKEFEMSTFDLKTNREIFEKLMELLEALPRENKKLKNRYIDLSELRIIGQYIDWKLMINDSN